MQKPQTATDLHYLRHYNVSSVHKLPAVMSKTYEQCHLSCTVWT